MEKLAQKTQKNNLKFKNKNKKISLFEKKKFEIFLKVLMT